MKFRKIIREEIDDLQWIKDVKPNLNFYVTSKLLKPGDIISVTGEMIVFDVYNTTWVNNLELEITNVGKEIYNVDFKFVNPETARKIGFGGASEDELAFMVQDGDLIVTSHQKNLNESQGDGLDWIRDIGPKDTYFKIGDIIRVHKIGTEKAYLSWLGDYARYYVNGAYGHKIEGEIIELSPSYIKIETNRGRYDDRISFPTYEKLMSNTIIINYPGLDLLYEIIG